MKKKEGKEESGVYEIIPGMTVEEMKSMFFDEKALIEAPCKVWQLNSKGYRYYYTCNDFGEPTFYPSVTTILSQTMPKSPHLIKWIADKGFEEAERYKNERAAYGTFMHAIFEDLIINRTFDLDDLKGKLKAYIEQNKLPEDFIYYADDLKKDLLSFAQFVIDYKVEPLAVEIALVHPYGYGGMIDLPCKMLQKIGGRKKINAIVDFKSGRKGFYEEAEIQLHMYKDMWNQNFPDCLITKVFNFSPKDWRKKPTYNLKDQTNSNNACKIPSLLELASIEDGKKEKVFTAVSGKINLDKEKEFSKNVISLSLSELVKKKRKQKTPKKEEQGNSIEELTKDSAKKKAVVDKPDRNGRITSAKKEKSLNAKKKPKMDLLNSDIEI